MTEMDSAQPSQEILDELNEYKKLYEKHSTLRDQFAMAALTGLTMVGHDYTNKELATYSYDVADAMMEARKK